MIINRDDSDQIESFARKSVKSGVNVEGFRISIVNPILRITWLKNNQPTLRHAILLFLFKEMVKYRNKKATVHNGIKNRIHKINVIDGS